MLNFDIICFLKVDNVDIFLKLSSREFHSLMDDGIQDFCKILVRFRGTDILLLFLNGLSGIALTKGGIKSCMLEGTMPVLTLCMNDSLCWCLLCDRVAHPHSLYRFSNDTDLVNPVTSRAASFWTF